LRTVRTLPGLNLLLNPKTPALRSQPLPDLRELRSILVLRLDHAGDVILTVPFLRELRRNCPQARITLAIAPATRNLVELCPYINDLRLVPTLGLASRGLRMLGLYSVRHFSERFDMAIIPRWDDDAFQAVHLAYFNGARWRIGYSETVRHGTGWHNRGYDRFLTHPIRRDPSPHEVQRYLDVLRFLGGNVQDDRLELWTDSADEEFASEQVGLAASGGGPLVALGPGSWQPKRRWPTEHFAAVARRLREAVGARFVVLGGRDDRFCAERLQTALGPAVLNLAGRTTLRQAGAILRRCALFVGNDTGLMHLATAAGVPVVEISCHSRRGDAEHDNSPIRFGPWQVPARVLQPDNPRPPCTDACRASAPHCIGDISEESVFKAALDLLESVS
jgi:heptosyltransferase-2